MKIVNLKQGSPDWLKWRETGLGASDACHLLGDAPWNSPKTLKAIKLGRKKVFLNPAMKRGQQLEPMVRLLFQQLTGLRIHPVCCHHDTHEWMKASLDGLSEDRRTVVEIKCPQNPKGHEIALQGKPPSYYRPQLQHQLMVTRADRVVYCSYHPDFEAHKRLVVVDEWPDEGYQERLLAKELGFWNELKQENPAF